MIITDKFMLKRMERALKAGNNLFTLDDIGEGLRSGHMQGHVEGNTWAITQVHDWPQRRSVNILVVVGNMADSLKLEEKITAWAKEKGADHITGVGRDGWWNFRTLGWKKQGVLYSKDI